MVAALALLVAFLGAAIVSAQDEQYELRFALPPTTEACRPFDIRYQTFPTFTLATFAPVTLNLYINTIDGASTAIVTSEAVVGQGNFTVPQLLVRPGQYILSGVDSQGYNINGQSEPFTVTVNNDAACLAAVQFPAPASPDSEPSPTVLATASVASVSGGSATGSAQSGTIQRSGGMSAGAKAGIAIGVIGSAVLLLVGAWYVFRRRQNAKTANSPVRAYAPNSKSGGAGGIGSDTWKGLSSVENVGGGAYAVHHEHEPKSYRNSGVSMASTDEKPSTYHYPPHDPNSPVYPSAAAFARTPSTVSRATDPYADHHAAGGHSGSSSSSNLSTPTTPTSKQFSTSAKGRKPVPNYSAAEMDSAASNPFNSRPTSFSATSVDPQEFGDSPTTPSPLKHQASFGEKPMQHVLIPDMPPPKRTMSPPVHMR